MSTYCKELFSLIDLSKTFTQGNAVHEVLSRINFDFHLGKSYAITGESGTGKSTLLYLLAGLDQPTSGSILFNGRPLNNLDKEARLHHARYERGIIVQFPSLIQELTIMENCVLPALIAGTPHDHAQERAISLLKAVGLEDKLHAVPDTLSGGQQQRACVARALVNNPVVILADEPTANLDPVTGQQVINILLDCCRQQGVTVIMSTHDPNVSEQVEVHLALEGKKLVKKP